MEGRCFALRVGREGRETEWGKGSVKKGEEKRNPLPGSWGEAKAQGGMKWPMKILGPRMTKSFQYQLTFSA